MENRRPREGERKAKWDHHKAPHTPRPFEGYKAGPLVCAKSHTIGGSKPCLLIYTGGKVQCMCQKGPVRTEWIGWLPFWDSEDKGRFLTVRENMFDRIDNISDHVRFIFGRGEGKKDTVWVREGEPFARCPYKARVNAGPVDLMPFLQETLWGYPFLAEYRTVEQPGTAPAKPAAKPAAPRLIPTNDDQAERERLAAIRKKPVHEVTAPEAVEAHRVLDFLTQGAIEKAHRKNGHLPKKG